MSCGNQPAHISVIIVAALPSVDGTAAHTETESQKLIKEKNKSKAARAAQFDKSLHISQG
jgi:hypothetical protein